MARKPEDRLDRIERILERAEREIADLGGAIGRFAEGLVAPSLRRALTRFGIEIHGHRCRASEHRNGDAMEIDIVGLGRRGERDVVVAVEAETFLQASDVNHWVAQLERFRDFFREYRAYDLVAGVAGMQRAEGAVRHAEREGLLVLGPSDDVAEVLNRPGFRPRVWPAARRGRRSDD